jgi:hypothetical protein
MTTYENHAPRSIRWETARVLDGTLRVDVTAAHAESPVWKATAQEVIDAWTRERSDLPWRRVTPGSTSLFVEGLAADLRDVVVVQSRLEELADAVNAEIAARAREEARAEEAHRVAEQAARDLDARLTDAFRVPPSEGAGVPGADEGTGQNARRHDHGRFLRRHGSAPSPREP